MASDEIGDAADDRLTGDRLDDLEAAEEERQAAARLDRRFELIEALLLSIAAVLAAWAGFQATKWSGVQADEYSRAGASRVEAAKAASFAGQESIIDVVMFTEWLLAVEEEGLLDDPLQSGASYVPDPSEVSGFLYDNFREEFRPAVDAWLAAEPRENPDAPSNPFAMDEYLVQSRVDAERFEQEADGHAAEAREANQISDDYVLTTIMFASVLFFAGISSKMDTARARIVLLGVGGTLLVLSFVVVMSFPIEI